MIDNNYIKYENHIKWFKQNKKTKNAELLILMFKIKK